MPLTPAGALSTRRRHAQEPVITHIRRQPGQGSISPANRCHPLRRSSR
ncbi:hypothetical protein HMPREF3150_02646 [Pseudomonas aeruginosa]|nr:hypothetical protein HMPREF3150_02646 [Pseudomonas aeruginosa]